MKLLYACLIILPCLYVSGCAVSRVSNNYDASLSVIHAAYSDKPINLDGLLNDAVWQTAPIYTLSKSQDNQGDNAVVYENGRVQISHDKNYLYIAIQFNDSDVVAEGDQDQLHHDLLGDLAEVFIKPMRERFYWEMYATPLSHKSIFFYPSRGRLGLPSGFDPPDADKGLRVAAQVQGTCNNWRDRDTHWTAEMAISKAKLSSMGVPFNSDESWTIFFGRYNYSRYLGNRELTMYPSLLRTDYHQYEEFPPLILDPAPTR